MIYYTNATLTLPHMAFIGRWSPFHKGHVAIMNKKRSEHPSLPVLIMIRNTKEDAYTPSARAEYIKIWMLENNVKGTVMIVPNIEGVYWGRGVGYNVGLVDVDRSVQQISATDIRRAMTKRSSSWHKVVANENAAYVLSPSISEIIHQGLVIWLTGCPSSGKTTIAQTMEKELHMRYPHIKTQILDGDDMRASPLAIHVGFSKKERADHIRRMAYVAKMFADHGIVVICAFVSPDRAVRQQAQTTIGKRRFKEIYIFASKKTRMNRDTKGLYKKAVQGKLTNLTGYNVPYEKPSTPLVVCNTDVQTVSSCVLTIIARVFPTDDSHIV